MLYPGHFTSSERDLVLIGQEAGWTLGPVWIDPENFITGVQTPDCPDPNESLYQLCCLACLIVSL